MASSPATPAPTPATIAELAATTIRPYTSYTGNGYDTIFNPIGHYSSYTSLNEASHVLLNVTAGASSSTSDTKSKSSEIPRVYDLTPDEVARHDGHGHGHGNGVREATSSYWQNRFEEALSLPTTTMENQLTKARSLKSITSEFGRAAERIGRIIIEQSTLPIALRTYKPLQGKGVAGGEKYLVEGIFIKLTRDIAGIYGGDSSAAKAAKHEIRSLKELIACDIPQLFFPMLSIVDYMGLRLVCTSYIDGIGSTSLVYGSQDGGHTIHSSNAIMNQKIRDACEKKNLRAHNVIGDNGMAMLMYGPADLEGHVITRNGRPYYYMLDFARLMPPEAPTAPSARSRGSEGLIIDTNMDTPMEHFMTPDATRFLRAHLSVLPSDVKRSGDQQAAGDGNDEKVLVLRVQHRSEGVLAYNDSATHCPLNPRASSIAGYAVYGKACLFQDTGKIFFRMLRSELVSSYRGALSSDAFSGFGACKRCTSTDVHDCCPHEGELHHQWLDEATEQMLFHRLPQFAKDMEQRVIAPSDSVALVKALHRAGINVRHLGSVHYYLSTPTLRAFVLTETVTRTLRFLLTSELRSAHKPAILPGGIAFSLCSTMMTGARGVIVAAATKAANAAIAAEAAAAERKRLGLRGDNVTVVTTRAINTARASVVTWICTACTYENKPVASVCEICGTRPPTTTTTPTTTPTVAVAPTSAAPSPPPPTSLTVATSSSAAAGASTPDVGYQLYTGRAGDQLPQDTPTAAASTPAPASTPVPAPSGELVITYSGLAGQENATPNDRVADPVFSPATPDPSSAATTPGSSYTAYNPVVGASLPSSSIPAAIATPAGVAAVGDVAKRAREIAIRFFNLMFGNCAESELFWKQDVALWLGRKFPTPADRDRPWVERVATPQDASLRSSVLQFPLFVRLQDVSGVRFTRECNQRCFTDPAKFFASPLPFTDTDLLTIESQVKSIDFDDQIDVLLYDLALVDVTGKGAGEVEMKDSVAVTTTSSSSTATTKAAPPLIDVVSSLPPNTPSGVIAAVTATTSTNSDATVSRAVEFLAGGAPAKRGMTSMRNVDIRLGYHARAVEVYNRHPLVISSCFKLAMDVLRKGMVDQALHLTREGMTMCGELLGPYHPLYVVGESTLAALLLHIGDLPASIASFERAILATERIHGHHPLLAKLTSSLGRVLLMIGHHEDGVRHMTRGYGIYEEFYGKTIAEYLAPVCIMGKADEIAHALGELAHTLKPLLSSPLFGGTPGSGDQPPSEEDMTMIGFSFDQKSAAAATPAKKSEIRVLYDRLLSAIGTLEDMEGFTRGFYMGASLKISKKALRAISQRSDEHAPIAGSVILEDGAIWGHGLDRVVAGEVSTFYVRATEPPEVIIGASRGGVLLRGFVTQRVDGIYMVNYLPVASGACQHTIVYTPITGGDKRMVVHTSNIVPSSFPLARRCTIDGATTSLMETEYKFKIRAFDAYGNTIPQVRRVNGVLPYMARWLPRLSGGSLLNQAPPIAWTETNNGDWIASSMLSLPGKYELSVRVAAQEAGCWRNLADGFMVEVKAPEGKQWCLRPVMGSGVALYVCQTCHRRRGNKCIKCNTVLAALMPMSSPAKLCTNCGIKATNRCRECPSPIAIGFGQQLMLCRMCALPPAGNLCCGIRTT